MKLKEATKLLWDKGYAFSNQGDVDVSIAGLIGTGVHGTGITHPSISTHVQTQPSLHWRHYQSFRK